MIYTNTKVVFLVRKSHNDTYKSHAGIPLPMKMKVPYPHVQVTCRHSSAIVVLADGFQTRDRRRRTTYGVASSSCAIKTSSGVGGLCCAHISRFHNRMTQRKNSASFSSKLMISRELDGESAMVFRCGRGSIQRNSLQMQYQQICSVPCSPVWQCHDRGPALSFPSSFSASLHPTLKANQHVTRIGGVASSCAVKTSSGMGESNDRTKA